MNIGRSSEIIKNIKNHKNDSTAIVDDLFVLSLLKKHNIKVHTFIYCDDYDYKSECLELIEYFKSTSTSYIISNKIMKTLMHKENCCHLIAECDLNLVELNKLKDSKFLIINDRIEIPGNLGTIYRSADATNVDGIVLVDAVTKLNNIKLVHASRGMNILIKTAYASFKETVDFLLDNNFNVYIGEPVEGISYDKAAFDGKIAIVVGSERYGSNKLWLDYDVNKVFIPMDGEITSLNVSIAASILMYEVKRKQ
ncbi:MAG: TrmH family RNA methyltransferase [bacterium]